MLLVYLGEFKFGDLITFDFDFSIYYKIKADFTPGLLISISLSLIRSLFVFVLKFYLIAAYCFKTLNLTLPICLFS